ncbi:Thioredoxin [Pedobacter suwonensis]|uniref:Thioredoxin n=2 Tax=Pedobacter suwonensis TaxID=332999 RepID=A0A1I0SPE4_9SPHI|nr:Thioredoxin [Pedobacter suwonensis]
MKLKLCFLLWLCPFFGGYAQDNKLGVVSDIVGSGGSGEIKIGDRVPEVLIGGVSGWNGAGKGLVSLPLSAFRGKLLILDFWATWCSPCVAMIPKMEALQEEFKDRVQFLPVAYQSFKVVDDFYGKLRLQQGKQGLGPDRGFSLPMVTGDTVLVKLFPHQTLPHYVWIGPDGVLKAVTGMEAVSREHIKALLEGDVLDVKMKRDEQMRYDTGKPLFFEGSDWGDGFFRSQLSGYITDIGRGIYKDVEVQSGAGVRRITGRNLTMPELFRLAYKKGKKETVLEDGLGAELEPHLAGTDFLDWLRQGRAYCFELMVEEGFSNRAYALMQGQLRGFFPDVEVGLETRKVNALALVRTSAMDKIRTSGGQPAVALDRFGARLTSCLLSVFIERLQLPLQGIPLPVIDQTGYKGMVDLELTANMSSIEELNKALARYDLRFVEKTASVEMLVIRKRFKKI